MTEEAPRILRFEPPYPIFRIEVDGDTETVVTEPLPREQLQSRMRVAIPNPWSEDEVRFLPGLAIGDGSAFILEIGESFGSVRFDEEHGWVCEALISKGPVLQGLQEALVQSAQSYTQRLLKRAKL